MPYIPKERREFFEGQEWLEPETAGELNFLFTRIIMHYIDENPSYQVYNDIIGALECCKLELYRRLVSNYEELKRIENGDVYE